MMLAVAMLATVLLGAATVGCQGGERPRAHGEDATADTADAQRSADRPGEGHADAPKELIITITADGERYLNDGDQHRNQAPVSRRELAQVLAEVAAETPEISIRLDVDRRVRYYHLIDITDTLELYGLRNIHLRSADGVHDEHD